MSVIKTVCQKDCPDTCFIDVTVDNGRIISTKESRLNPVTQGFLWPRTNDRSAHLYAEGLIEELLLNIDVSSAHISITNQIQGHHRHYYFVNLIHHLAERKQHAPVKFSAGKFHFVHRYAQGELIAGAHGLKPAQFVHPRTSQASRASQIVFNKQPHEQTAGVLTAIDEAAVYQAWTMVLST